MNKKSVKDRAFILGLLTEGNSLRSTARIADCSLNTVLRLLEDAGEACRTYQYEHLRDLPCKRIEVDEMHCFIGCRQKNIRKDSQKPEGDFWVWTSLCPDTKLMPCWVVGPRDAFSARQLMTDLASRMKGRIQLTTDGLTKYPDVIESVFGAAIDYAVLQKKYDKPDEYIGPKRYAGSLKLRKIGNPDMSLVSTSYIERSNLHLRMNCKRFTRKTNAFSKTFANHCHALSLHFMFYNYARIHGSLRTSPAMAAGVADRLWDLEDIARLIE